MSIEIRLPRWSTKKWFLGQTTGAVILNALLAACIVAGICSPTGCGRQGSAEQGDSQAQWSAYAFDNVTVPVRGDSGVLKSFQAQITTTRNGVSTVLCLKGVNQGMESIQVETVGTRSNNESMLGSPDATVVTTLQCSKIQHRITIVKDGLSAVDPRDWMDIVVWIPTADRSLSRTFFGVCVQAQYADSSGDMGFWSYSGPPQSEGVGVAPYHTGRFNGVDENVLYALYAMPLQFIGEFTVGEGRFLADQKYSIKSNGITVDHQCFPVLRSIGDCDFNSWELEQISAGNGARNVVRASLCPDLPIPFYISCSAQTGAESGSIEFMLEDLEIA